MNRHYDVIIVGSGVAGLYAAIRASEFASVALVTKAALEESNTRYAQGGIAAATFDDDSAELHIQDTLIAGAGLCDEEAVRVLCEEGPSRIYDLVNLGLQIDSEDGTFHRGREAAHSRARVLHAGGDATGFHIESTLVRELRNSRVDVYEHTFLVDLIASPAIKGVRLLRSSSVFELDAGAVILASGGAGQLYAHTTNPAVATGDGTAAAFRAGAMVSDSEFYQFHPTALVGAGGFLISEAVRGEGAVLRNSAGVAFMPSYDERADLAPRDIVARAIVSEMNKQDGQPVVLDATAMSSEFLTQRFPTISKHLESIGIDWSTTPIPVTPAAHYWMGGVRTDTWGRTSVRGLFAIGETACTGVHGANRLASNSLLEGLVFGGRAVRRLREGIDWKPTFTDEVHLMRASEELGGTLPTKTEVQALMWQHAGLVRDEAGLEVAAKQLTTWAAAPTDGSAAQNEVRNLITVGRILTTAALARLESRGGHYRADYAESSEAEHKHRAFTC